MRVLVATAPQYGHFYPLVPVCWALRAAGHEVRVAVPPGFVAAVAAAGLLPVSVGTDVELDGSAGGGPALRSWVGPPFADGAQAPSRFARLADVTADDMLAFGRDWRPDLVLHEPLALAGPAVAAALGIPSVRHLWGVDVTARPVADAMPALAGLRRRLGLRGAWPAPALVLDPCPPDLQVGGGDGRTTIRHVPFNGAAAAPAWAARRPPGGRVLVTMGTVASRLGCLTLVERLIDAAADLDVELVVALRAEHRAGLAPVPPHVRVAESVPLDLVLPGCDAVVHHGGAGTTLASLAHGLPQVVVPVLADNFTHAERVVACGAGRSVAFDAAVTDLRAALVSVLTRRGYRDGAAGLRAQMAAQPPPSVAVGRLELLTGTSVAA